MLGKALSPWTLSWFGSAVAFLLLALGLALAAGIGPGEMAQPQALAVIHLFALGWLGQVMLGALVQFAPVLAARPLIWPRLALPALVTCSVGTLFLATGFLSLAGHDWALLFFVLGPLALGAGFVMVTAMIIATLVTKQNLHLAEVRMVMLAIAGLAGLWLTGGMMATSLVGGPLTLDLTQALPLHLLFAIGGFLSFAAFGVSFKLFAMFLIAPDDTSWQRHGVFLLSLGAAALMVLALVVVAIQGNIFGLLLAISALALGACTLYLAEVRRIWHMGRRPHPELNMSWSRAALGFLAVAVLILPIAIWKGEQFAEAAVFAALVGWLSTLTLAQIIRITAFLTWLQIFAPMIGRRKIPLVQNLIAPRRAIWALAVWSIATALGIASLLAGFAPGFGMALAGLLCAALMIARELLAIRSLRHLPAAERPAELPPLVLPVPNLTPLQRN